MTIQTEAKTKHTIWPFNMNVSNSPNSDGSSNLTRFASTVDGITYDFLFYRNASVVYLRAVISGTATATFASRLIGQADNIIPEDSQLRFFYFDAGAKVFKIEINTNGEVMLNITSGDVLTAKFGFIDLTYKAEA
jgi:hypothetical protein